MGMGFLVVPINMLSYNDMKPEQSNQISSMVNLMRNMGGSIGISFVTGMVICRQQNYLVGHTYQYNPLLQQTLAAMAKFGAERTNPSLAMQRAYGQIYAALQQQAAVLAYIDVFWIMGIISLLAIAILFFARKTKPGQAAMGH